MRFLSYRLQNGSPYAIGLLSILSVLSCLPVTLVYCGQTVGWIKVKLGVEVGLGPGHILLDGDGQSSPRKKGALPQVLAHVCCGPTSGGINMPLSTEIGLSPSHIVLYGDPAPPPKRGGQTPNFQPTSVVAKRLNRSRCDLVQR